MESHVGRSKNFLRARVGALNADASRVNRLSHFKSLHEIASSIEAMCPAAKDSGLVVCSSCIRQSWRRGTRREREVINYQGRTRKREKKRIRACEDRYL